LNTVSKTVSTQYLVYNFVVKKDVNKKPIEDYPKIMGNQDARVMIVQDIVNLFTLMDHHKFNEVLMKILGSMEQLVNENENLLKVLLDICDAEFFQQLEMELSSNSMTIFSNKLTEIIKHSLKWPTNAQMQFWNLITSQYAGARKYEITEILTYTVDLLNSFLEYSIFEDKSKVRTSDLQLSFRRFCLYAILRTMDEKESMDYLALLMDLDRHYSAFLYSILNQFASKLVRTSTIEYIKNKGEENKKIGNLAYHMRFWKSKAYVFKNEASFMDNHLKNLLTKIFTKHKIVDDFKDLLE